MKILIISDLHGNWEALHALPERDYDLLFCLGDLVDYGPNPHEVVAFVREHAAACVRGNHDNAIAYGTDCRCTPAYRRLSETTRQASLPLLDSSDLDYLRALPEQSRLEVRGVRFFLTHATVRDPLFGYLAADRTQEWAAEIENLDADVVLTGHTHIAFARKIGSRWLINPGSVGQSKMQGGRACYAIWEDGEVRLHSVPYPAGETVAKLHAWKAVPDDVRASLAKILETGSGPQ